VLNILSRCLTTKFGVVTHMGRGVLRGSATPLPIAHNTSCEICQR